MEESTPNTVIAVDGQSKLTTLEAVEVDSNLKVKSTNGHRSPSESSETELQEVLDETIKTAEQSYGEETGN